MAMMMIKGIECVKSRGQWRPVSRKREEARRVRQMKAAKEKRERRR